LKSEKYPFFTELYLEGCYTITIDSSKSDTIRIEGEENILPHIRSENQGAELKLYPDRPISCTHPLLITLKKRKFE